MKGVIPYEKLCEALKQYALGQRFEGDRRTSASPVGQRFDAPSERFESSDEDVGANEASSDEAVDISQADIVE